MLATRSKKRRVHTRFNKVELCRWQRFGVGRRRFGHGDNGSRCDGRWCGQQRRQRREVRRRYNQTGKTCAKQERERGKDRQHRLGGNDGDCARNSEDCSESTGLLAAAVTSNNGNTCERTTRERNRERGRGDRSESVSGSEGPSEPGTTAFTFE